MFGFVAAGIAFIALIILMNIKISPEEAAQIEAEKAKQKAKKAKKKKEEARLKAQKQKEKEALPIEEPKNTYTRSVMDKTTERLVQLMEECSVAEIRQAVNNGISLQAPLEDGQTVLMIAVKHNQDPEVIPFLRENGIDINAVDDRGQTALMLAATFNPSPEITKALLDNGADKTIKDKNGKTAADYVKMNFDLIDSDIPALLFIPE